MDPSVYSIINFSRELLTFVRDGEFERVKDIIEKSSLYHKTDISGSKLMHYSAEYNNDNFTKFLINKGCDVDAQNTRDLTPLMIAVKRNHQKVMKILLAAGGDIFKLNNEKQSSLHMLQEQDYGQCSIFQLLLQELQKKCSTNEKIAEKLVSN